MRQLYVFTAGEPAARDHLDDTIKRMAPSSWLDDYLDHKEAEYLKSLLPDQSGFYAWGAVPGKRNIPMWEAMQEGDIVLTVYENHYHYISTVISKLNNPALAKRIWGSDDKGNTWEYMYFLTEPKPINIHVTSEPAISYLNNGYRGFTRISDERVTKIRQDYGSLETFFDEAFSSPLPPSVVERQLKEAEAESGSFDPNNLVDGRKKVLAEITRRRGQPKFRKALLEAYSGSCAVTGCDVETVLEAAHIVSYAGDETNHVTNGLLLRADIHTLFDLGELKIDRNGVIHIGDKLGNTPYSEFHGKKIRRPDDLSKGPNREALTMKFSQVV